MKNKNYYPISKKTVENEKFIVKDFQEDPKELITKGIKKLDDNLKCMYITNRWQKDWFCKLTECRLIIRKLYTLIN